MRRATQSIDYFQGLVTSLNPRMIGDSHSPDMQNVTVEDGSLNVRYGYQVHMSTYADGLQNYWGFDYFQGYYDDPNKPRDKTITNEYILFQEVRDNGGSSTFGSGTLDVVNPASDIANTNWVDEAAGTTNLFNKITDSDDATFILSTAAGASFRFAVNTTLGDPNADSAGGLIKGTTIRLYLEQCYVGASTLPTILTGSIYTSSTLLHTVNMTVSSSAKATDYVDFQLGQVLTNAEADALRFQVLDHADNINRIKIFKAYVHILPVMAISVVGSHGSAARQTIGGSTGSAERRFHPSLWRGFSWKNYAYLYNPNDRYPLYRHKIGIPGDLQAVEIANSPTVAPTFSLLRRADGTAGDYYKVAWHTSATGVAVAGALTSVDETGGNLVLSTSAGALASSITVTLSNQTIGGVTGGQNPDWHYNDLFSWYMSSEGTIIDPASVVFSLTTVGGTTYVASRVDSNASSFTPGYGFTAVFENKDYASWDGATNGNFKIATMTITFTVLSQFGDARDNLVVTPITIGAMMSSYLIVDFIEKAKNIELGYSYYNSTDDFESGLSPTVVIDKWKMVGMGGAGGGWLGVFLRLTLTCSSDSTVDKIRVNQKDNEGRWRRLETITDTGSTVTWDYRNQLTDLALYTQYLPSPFDFTNTIVATPFKQWVVWGKKGGSSNIRHSRIGNPVSLYSVNDSIEDETRPADFSLADDLADEPLWMFQAGDALIIGGDQGVYAQTGNSPSTMRPPKKLPGSFGCAGALSACRFLDENGNACVAYLTKGCDSVYLVSVSPSFDGETGFTLTELTAGIRGKIASYLGATASLFRMGAHEARSALWLIYGQKALVLRRPSSVDGKRYWEPYYYPALSSDTIAYIAFTTRGEMRWLRSRGKMDSVERTGPTNYFTSDDGTAITQIYWTSKTFVGPNRRIDRVEVVRDTIANTPTVTGYCDRQPSGISKTWTASKRSERFSALQQGTEHSFKIAMTAGDGAIRRFIYEELGRLTRKPTL